MTNTKKITITAIFIAIGIVLPIAFHALPDGGQAFLPMHIPVLMCGLIVSPLYGFLAGVLTPLLSSLLTGMPPVLFLPAMLFELAAYGLVASLCMKYLNIKNATVKLYVSLIIAMIVGRVVSGLVNALFFAVGHYSMQIWLTASFVTALPGIIIILILVPLIILALKRFKAI
ncbi:ECF transporter S component [Lactococcus termiticola]|uniref:ECF transporter S component n=1 Tax=Lactococcus termiticola TaxID=2169526 RepID=A0A2R5HCU7_9LACT|nr:ECF transporter S component [Lactococcus termiticola]GBG95913.1 hypothetical protein NtB2_00015 [Lactococcus termiticola]